MGQWDFLLRASRERAEKFCVFLGRKLEVELSFSLGSKLSPCISRRICGNVTGGKKAKRPLRTWRCCGYLVEVAFWVEF